MKKSYVRKKQKKPAAQQKKQKKRNQDDYDNPWKTIITKYFKELMLFFFPDIALEIDWGIRPVFLDKEFQQITRNAETGARIADKLIQIHTKKGEKNWVLIHVEVQSQYDANFSKRIYTYNYRIFDMYDRKVASLAIFADDNPDWKPDFFSHELWGCKASIKYPIAKILDYKTKWSKLEQDTNPFSTVVMAHLQTMSTRNDPAKRFDSKFLLIRGLFKKGYNKSEITDLFAFIDWLMRLPKDLEQSLWQKMENLKEESKMPYITSLQRIGIKEGKKEGAGKILSNLITLKFQVDQDHLTEVLSPLSLEQLENLSTKIFESETFDDMKMWIDEKNENNIL